MVRFKRQSRPVDDGGSIPFYPIEARCFKGRTSSQVARSLCFVRLLRLPYLSKSCMVFRLGIIPRECPTFRHPIHS